MLRSEVIAVVGSRLRRLVGMIEDLSFTNLLAEADRPDRASRASQLDEKRLRRGRAWLE